MQQILDCGSPEVLRALKTLVKKQCLTLEYCHSREGKSEAPYCRLLLTASNPMQGGAFTFLMYQLLMLIPAFQDDSR